MTCSINLTVCRINYAGQFNPYIYNCLLILYIKVKSIRLVRIAYQLYFVNFDVIKNLSPL